jgi:hypothetical protein
MCFHFLYNFCLKYFSFKEEMSMFKNIYLVFMSNSRYSCQNLTKPEFSPHIFDKFKYQIS